MSAYFVFHNRVHNAAKMEEYIPAEDDRNQIPFTRRCNGVVQVS